jgi:hypothetical protein
MSVKVLITCFMCLFTLVSGYYYQHLIGSRSQHQYDSMSYSRNEYVGEMGDTIKLVMKYIQDLAGYQYRHTQDASACDTSKQKSKRVIQYCKKNKPETIAPSTPAKRLQSIQLTGDTPKGLGETCTSLDEMHYNHISCSDAKSLLNRGYPGLCNTMIGQRRCLKECMQSCDSETSKDKRPPSQSCNKDGAFDVNYYLSKYDDLNRAFRYNHTEATDHWGSVGKSTGLIGCDGCCPGVGVVE